MTIYLEYDGLVLMLLYYYFLLRFILLRSVHVLGKIPIGRRLLRRRGVLIVYHKPGFTFYFYFLLLLLTVFI